MCMFSNHELHQCGVVEKILLACSLSLCLLSSNGCVYMRESVCVSFEIISCMSVEWLKRFRWLAPYLCLARHQTAVCVRESVCVCFQIMSCISVE